MCASSRYRALIVDALNPHFVEKVWAGSVQQ